MRFAWIHQHRHCWPVRTMCRVLNVSVSGYYDAHSRRPGKRARRRAAQTKRVEAIHADSRRTYGSPRVYQQLKEEGEKISEKTVASIMKERKIQGKTPRRPRPITTDSNHHWAPAENLLERDFTATAPNQKWVADITYIDTAEGWSYLAVVLDLFSRRVVGWALADHMRGSLVAEALDQALQTRRPGRGLVHHSDRGSQYACGDFQRRLKQHGIICSMSRKGDCYDNAVMESFFGTLKTELDEPLASRRAAHRALFEYIEVFYNRQRLHSTLNYQSPAAFEAKYLAAG